MRKRIFSLGLVLVLILTMSLSVFADNLPTDTPVVTDTTVAPEVTTEPTTAAPTTEATTTETPVVTPVVGDTEGTLLYDLGLITGTGTGDLAENKTLTREEMVTILWKLSTNKATTFVPPTTPTFTDVPADHWAYAIVEESYALGLTSGVSEGVFGLGKTVTYQQAVAFLSKALGEKVSWGSVVSATKSKHGIYSTDGEKSPQLLRKHIFEMVVTALESKHVDGELLINKTDRLSETKKDAFKTKFDHKKGKPSKGDKGKVEETDDESEDDLKDVETTEPVEKTSTEGTTEPTTKTP